MKLESKLGLSTGVLIVAMFLSALTAHVRIEEANHLSDVINTNRIPLIMGSRDVGSHLIGTITGLNRTSSLGSIRLPRRAIARRASSSSTWQKRP